MAEVKWTGNPGQDEVYAIITDGTYLYVALYTSPALVIKLDPATMLPVGSPWTGAAGENMATSLCFDGTYIYAGLDVSPGKVVQIDPSTMTTVAVWTGAGGEDSVYGVTAFGGFVYASMFIFPAKVRKIDPATMTSSGGAWTGVVGQRGIPLCNDGTFLYHAVSVTGQPCKCFKIDVSTMTTSQTFTNTAGHFGDPRALKAGSGWIFLGIDDSPSEVVKIQPAGMTDSGRWTGASGDNNCMSLESEPGLVYVGLNISPGRVQQLDLGSMTTFQTWNGLSGEANVHALVLAVGGFLDNDLFVGCDTAPGQVIEVRTSDMKTRGSGGGGSSGTKPSMGARMLATGAI